MGFPEEAGSPGNERAIATGVKKRGILWWGVQRHVTEPLHLRYIIRIHLCDNCVILFPRIERENSLLPNCRLHCNSQNLFSQVLETVNVVFSAVSLPGLNIHSMIQPLSWVPPSVLKLEYRTRITKWVHEASKCNEKTPGKSPWGPKLSLLKIFQIYGHVPWKGQKPETMETVLKGRRQKPGFQCWVCTLSPNLLLFYYFF